MSSVDLQSVVVLLTEMFRMNPIILLVWWLGCLRKVVRSNWEYFVFNVWYFQLKSPNYLTLSFLVWGWAVPELWTADQIQDSRLMARCLKPTRTTTGAQCQALTTIRIILMTGVTHHLHHLHHHLKPTYSYTMMGPATPLMILSSRIFWKVLNISYFYKLFIIGRLRSISSSRAKTEPTVNDNNNPNHQ